MNRGHQEDERLRKELWDRKPFIRRASVCVPLPAGTNTATVMPQKETYAYDNVLD
jgi:hypothetical protein